MTRFRFCCVELRRIGAVLILAPVFLAVSLTGGPHVGAAGKRPNEVYVAAASSLRFALDALAAQYHQQTGVSIKISYGSSGDLVRQILHGAPFEIFMSADENFAQRLIDDGAANAPAVRYATGRIGFFVPPKSRLGNVAELEKIVDMLASGKEDAIAIANPEHAPYGRAAMECLRAFGVWDRLAAHLIIGENATQAAQFAATGRITAGIVPLSLVARSPLAAQGRFFLLPSSCHRPLHQSMVLTDKADGESQSFFMFLSSRSAGNILKSFGFDDPEQGE